MKIQSLSVVVPAKKCVNDCKFCVSKMHDAGYENMIAGKNLYYNLYLNDYLERLQYARDNGCNTVMLTGDCEPLQSWGFLRDFGLYNRMIKKPFRTIEIQTAGNLLTDEYLYFLRHHVGVKTISLSVSDIWNDEYNAEIIGCRDFSLEWVCSRIKQYRFNLRLSLNMSDHMFRFGTRNVHDILDRCEKLQADQITFRKLYESGGVRKEEEWVRDYAISEDDWGRVNQVVTEESTVIDRLEYGRVKHDVRGMGIVVDDDCMSQEAKDVAKYLILRPDCKLYSKWDTKASLIF